MMKCDICMRYGEGTIVSAEQMRDAVFQKGFNPFELRLFPQETLSLSARSPEVAFEKWKRIFEIYQTDWNLCSKCFAAVKPLIGQPKPTGVTRNPPDDQPFDEAGLAQEFEDITAAILAAEPGKEHLVVSEFWEARRREAREQQPKPKSGCFIATAACGSAFHPEVQMLRAYRDRVLVRRSWGRRAIHIYQRLSPPIADCIQGQSWARRLVRGILVRPLARWASAKLRDARES